MGWRVSRRPRSHRDARSSPGARVETLVAWFSAGGDGATDVDWGQPLGQKGGIRTSDKGSKTTRSSRVSWPPPSPEGTESGAGRGRRGYEGLGRVDRLGQAVDTTRGLSRVPSRVGQGRGRSSVSV